MAALGAQSIASSYEQLLHVDADGGGNGTTLVNVKDGDNGTTFALQLASDKIQANGTLTVGADDTGYDVIFYGDTASSNMTWDTSGDDLILNDATLKIDQDDNATALNIDSESTGYNAINIEGCKYGILIIQDISGGRAGHFSRNIAEAGSNPLISIVDDNANNTQPALKIQQDGAAPSIELTGNGSIKFPGTQGASSDANSLDDYEEGTWTPYIKVGGKVTCWIALIGHASGDTTGDMAGLPFAIPNSAQKNAQGVIGYQNSEGGEVWGIDGTINSSSYTFRVGATQKQLLATKTLRGVFSYNVT